MPNPCALADSAVTSRRARAAMPRKSRFIGAPQRCCGRYLDRTAVPEEPASHRSERTEKDATGAPKSRLDKDLADDVAVNVGQPAVRAVVWEGEFLMVDAQ